MWKAILGFLGLVGGLPLGVVSFYLLAGALRINWYHGDRRADGLAWVTVPAVAAVCCGLGVLAGAAVDRWRARAKKMRSDRNRH
jgi:hypothetical protein